MSSVEELSALIASKGEEIRNAKASKASNIQELIADLLALKERYKKANNGVPFDPPKVEEKKKEKKATVEEPVREGPSKKELSKLARKEKKAAYKAGESSEGQDPSTITSTPGGEPGAVTSLLSSLSISNSSAVTADLDNITTIQYFGKSIPQLSQTILAIVPSLSISLSPLPASGVESLPYINTPSKGSISGDHNIARYLVRCYCAPLYGNNDPYLQSQIDQWLDICEVAEVHSVADLLNSHLADRTFTVGHSISLADLALYLFLSSPSAGGAAYANPAERPHYTRWLNTLKQFMSQIPPPPRPAKKGGGKEKSAGGAAGKGEKEKEKEAGAGEDAEDSGNCPALENAVEGQVCTRFPPEPSGYLHIGHAKAVLLNQYYAQRYKGKLLVRFDDTNPSKEKEEYEENIIQDLATLNVKADSVSHTSDHFATCEKLARKIITDGNAYMDDTDQEKMQAERKNMETSYRRESPIEENLAIFERLLKGELDAQKFCLRAKIDMSSPNGTLRDPVLYRYNATPHHMTGTRFKAYPTYDFACPIVDSIEGVTHALRTTEYNDRDEQYRWIQDALGLRKVNIQAFGKMNFVHTVLSKRKLNWFVEQGLVEGWFDPRFPTIQGCMRRGVNVEALKSFILMQGASRRVITMEWDKFWAENKKILEESSPRYMGVSRDTSVPFLVSNHPDEITAATIPLHPQKPEMGNRVVRHSNRLLLEQDDCKLFKQGEEVTLLRWGNFIIDTIETDASGDVKSMQGRYNPDATDFRKTKKVTWLADVPDLVPCQLVEFDHLISKAKLEEDEEFQNFVNPVTRAETSALCDPCLRIVQKGDVIQLERRGFFRCDQPYGGSKDKPAILFNIPDGKTKAMSTLSSALGHK